MYGHSSGFSRSMPAGARSRRGTATARTARPSCARKPGGMPVPGDRRAADHRGDRVVRRDDPRQVRVDAEQHRDAVQVEQERERRSPSSVWRPEERREAEEHAEREGRRRPLRRVVRCAAACPASGGRGPRSGESSEVAETRAAAAGPRRRRRRSTTARSAVQTPMRVSGTSPLARGRRSRRPRRGPHREQQLVVVAAGHAPPSTGSAARARRTTSRAPARSAARRRRSIAPTPLAVGDLVHAVGEAVAQIHARAWRRGSAPGARRAAGAAPGTR